MAYENSCSLQSLRSISNGLTNSVNALVERNGNFWIENLPGVESTDRFTVGLCATRAGDSAAARA